MACRVAEILMIIKTKIPAIFQEVIDKCKKEVENFEQQMQTLQNDTEELLDTMIFDNPMSEDVLRRFKEDQNKSLLKFREETEKNLRAISEKALSKIRDLNKKSQEVVNSVVDFQQEIKERIAQIIDKHEKESESLKLSESFRDLCSPLHGNFTKIRKEVEKLTQTLPKKMDIIYNELQSEIKKLSIQTETKSKAILEKYKRLTYDKI